MNILLDGADHNTARTQANYVNAGRQASSCNVPDKAESYGCMLDILGVAGDNSAYAGHGKSAEEIMLQAGQEDLTARRNYMAVMSNSMSDEDFARMQKEGFHPGSTDIETVVSIIDHIKAALVKGGVEVAGYTDTISEETLKDITGSEAFAIELKKLESNSSLSASSLLNLAHIFKLSQDLKDYFGVWLGQFFKHPLVYLEATVANTYGYFYPNTTSWYVYYKYDDRLSSAGFDYRYNQLEDLRNTLSKYANTYKKIPLIGLSVNIGFSFFVLMTLFIYVFYEKKYNDLLIFVPHFVLLFVCVASPVNTYFRYAMPYVFALPILFCITLFILNEKDR